MCLTILSIGDMRLNSIGETTGAANVDSVRRSTSTGTAAPTLGTEALTMNQSEALGRSLGDTADVRADRVAAAIAAGL